MLPSTESDPRPAPPPADGVRLCELLASARQRRGITLQHIADETKIPLRHLAALEREDLSALPAGLYRRAEVRAFARAVGVDDRLALGCLERLEAPPPSAEPLPQPPPAATAVFTRARLELAVGLALVAGVVFGRILWEHRSTAGPDTPAVVNLANRSVAPADPLREDEQAAAPELEAVAAALPAVSLEAATQAPDAPAVTAPANPAPAVTDPAPEASSGTMPPPGPAAGTGLSIVTEPRGARVTVNGVGWGETPVTIHHLPPGRKQIRVTLDGYQSVERIVQTDAGASRRVTIQLRQP
jgi:cytoskeletal protein RodZ